MHKASCHCGDVVAEIDADIVDGMECNCSHCSRKGFILAFFPRAKVNIRSAPGATTRYNFHRNAIDHHFCKRCGVQVHAFGKMPDGAETTAINLRCCEALDLTALKITRVDGRSF
jgi:hypothetical protein